MGVMEERVRPWEKKRKRWRKGVRKSGNQQLAVIGFIGGNTSTYVVGIRDAMYRKRKREWKKEGGRKNLKKMSWVDIGDKIKEMKKKNMGGE